MTNPQNEKPETNTTETSDVSAKPGVSPAPTPISKPVTAPVTAKVSVAPKPATPKPVEVDPSIVIEEDSSTSVAAFIVDAIAAAVAIAFTVLIAQEVMPFL